MRSQPIVPYTAAEQIDALKRMAPELAMGGHWSAAESPLEVLHRNLQRVAAESGVQLRIVEALPAMSAPNPLAFSRAQLRVLQWNICRGLAMAFLPLAIVTWLACCHREWLIALLTGVLTSACVSLFVMSRRASRLEVA